MNLSLDLKPERARRSRRAPWGPNVDRALEVAARQLTDLLSGLDLSALKGQLETDAAHYVRLVTALAKLSDARLAYDRRREEELEQQRKAREEAGAKATCTGLRQETLHRIERELNLF